VSRKSESLARLAAGETSRRSIRLGGYDYSYPGAYFVTVCAARRGLLFGWISDSRVIENANARIVRDCWLDLPNHYPHVSLDTFVVMPDHIHAIIVLLDTHKVGDVRAGLKPAVRAWSLRMGMRLRMLECDTGCLRSCGH
jgi:REP element-mobilizing transposase RayT